VRALCVLRSSHSMVRLASIKIKRIFFFAIRTSYCSWQKNYIFFSCYCYSVSGTPANSSEIAYLKLEQIPLFWCSHWRRHAVNRSDTLVFERPEFFCSIFRFSSKSMIHSNLTKYAIYCSCKWCVGNALAVVILIWMMVGPCFFMYLLIIILMTLYLLLTLKLNKNNYYVVTIIKIT